LRVFVRIGSTEKVGLFNINAPMQSELRG